MYLMARLLITSVRRENGQSRLKFNYRTGGAAVVMVNQNPGVEQSESGVEWLINNVSKFASESD